MRRFSGVHCLIQDLPEQHIYLDRKNIERSTSLQNEVLHLVMQDWVAKPDEGILKMPALT